MKDVNYINKIKRNPYYSKALLFALQVHKNEQRAGGEPFINHPLRTFLILSKVFAGDTEKDKNILISAILHDTLESDHDINIEDFEKIFGSEVTQIVTSLTLPIECEHNSKNKLEYLCKRLPEIALMEKNGTLPQGVIAVKLADRLDNVSTLDAFKDEKINRYLIETETILDALADSPLNREESFLYETLRIYVEHYPRNELIK